MTNSSTRSGPPSNSAASTSEVASGGGGWFGQWNVDLDGLPCFDLDLTETTQTADLVAPPGGIAECWHQIGGLGLVATAHAGGWTSIYATSLGMVRLTSSKSGWGITGTHTEMTGVRFGMGYAEWSARAAGWEITRRVSAAVIPDPVLRVDVHLSRDRNHHPLDGKPVTSYEEVWVPEPLPLLIGALMSPYRRPPHGYSLTEATTWRALYALSDTVRTATNAVRRAVARYLMLGPSCRQSLRAIVTEPRFPIPTAKPSSPAWIDLALPHIAVASLDDDRRWQAGGHALRVKLAGADDAVDLSFAVALAAHEEDLDSLIHMVRSQMGSSNAQSWGRCLEIDLPSEPSLAREARWHGSYLVGCQQPDALFGHRYAAQGSAYGFIHGLQGAPRDYAISSVPLSVLDPVGARQLLQVIMRMTTPGGATHYAHTGRGRCTSGGIHAAPTDLPIFFLWALTDYVFATGDRAFLDVDIPYYPPSRGKSATPRQRLTQAFEYLRERVGTGPHGLLRVGSGDWADPISAMVPDRRAFHESGESGFNTAFATYALPRAATMIESVDPETARSMRELAAGLRSAMEQAWTGRWFLRGYDGVGGTIGHDHLFVDGQVWALIAKIGSDDQRHELVRNIWTLCDEPSPIGATILDRPHPVRFGMLAPGWDCNGGVWAAINGLLAWGYALHDPDLAWRNLRKQSLHAHASAYPHIWYGIWSGPDAYNAHFGEQPGETFVQPATPMQEYPVMNSNTHAGPLLAILRVLGIEAEPSGLVVEPRGLNAPRFRLSTALGTLDHR